MRSLFISLFCIFCCISCIICLGVLACDAVEEFAACGFVVLGFGVSCFLGFFGFLLGFCISGCFGCALLFDLLADGLRDVEVLDGVAGEGCFHVVSPDGCRDGAAGVACVAGGVVADPDGCDELRGVADEPCVVFTVGGACLACCRAADVCVSAGASGNDFLEDAGQFVDCVFIDDLS